MRITNSFPDIFSFKSTFSDKYTFGDDHIFTSNHTDRDCDRGAIGSFPKDNSSSQKKTCPSSPRETF